MRLWHPKHGILFVTNQAEIDRLISTGGTEFDVSNKPWVKKESVAEVKEEVKAEPKLTINIPKRGRPAKTWQ